MGILGKKFGKVSDLYNDSKIKMLLSICISTIKDKKLYFLICNKNEKIMVGYYYIAENEKIEDIKYEEIMFGTGFGNLAIHINRLLEFDFSTGSPFDSKGQYVYIEYSNTRQITLPKKCENIDFIVFYRAINYLLSYAKVNKKYMLDFPDEYKKDIIDEAIDLDNEIIAFMKKFETGRKYSFEKELNEKWKNTNFNQRANEVCSKMNNFELVATIFLTEYVFNIGECLNRFKPFDLDYNENKEEKLSFLVCWIRYICESDLSEYFIEKILKKTEVEKYIKNLENVNEKRN